MTSPLPQEGGQSQPGGESSFLVYVAMAALALVTTVTGLWSVNSTVDDYESLTQRQARVHARLRAMNTLFGALQRMNAAGNDVFQSLDTAGERQRLRESQAEFGVQLARLRELMSQADAVMDLAGLQLLLDELAGRAGEMSLEAEEVFALMDVKNIEAASRVMSRMDRSFAQSNQYLSAIRRQLFDREDSAHEEGLAHQRQVRMRRNVLLVLSLASMMTLLGYGFRLQRRRREQEEVRQGVLEREKADGERLLLQAKQQKTIAELGYLALSGTDLQTLSDRAVVAVAEAIGVEWVEVLQLEADERTLVMRASAGFPPTAAPGERIAACPRAAERASLSRREVVLTGGAAKQAGHCPELPSRLRDLGACSGAAVVLSSHTRPFGLLGAYARRERTFTQDEQHFLQSVANVFGGAIERRQSEAAELERRKALEASRVKTQFLANMSHELRTPLNGIVGTLELADMAESGAEVREYLGVARASADLLLQLVNDVLDIARIEAQHVRLESVAFSLKDALQPVIGTLAARAQAKRVGLSMELAPDVPPQLVGDPTRLRQVLLNLLGNALKFTESGQVSLRVATRRVESSSIQLEFRVQDTGLGIAREKLEHIFDAFTQADDSTTRRFGGSGLGLAISRELVTLMGGELGVESELGRGSTFHFTATFGTSQAPGAEPALAPLQEGLRSLPAGQPDGGSGPRERVDAAVSSRDAAPAAVASEKPRPPSRGLRILLAEDNPTNTLVASRLLQRQGHQVTAVENGRLAVECVERQGPFDVVLMDLQMPEMDGYAATAAIRSLPSCSRLSIIALTAHALAEDRERCLAAGMDAYLSKPIRLERLHAALEEVAARRSCGQPSATQLSGWDSARRLELMELGDEAFVQMLVETWRSDAAAQMVEIRQAHQRGELVALERAAHRLKGASSSVGAVAVMEAAMRLETVSKQGNAFALAPMIGELDKAYGLACAALEARSSRAS